MYLYDLEKGSKIQIAVHSEEQKVEFETTVLGTKKPSIITEPIISDGKLVNFSSDNVKITIYAVSSENSKIYKYSNAVLRNVETSDQKYLQIVCESSGLPANRRGACRVWLGFEGILQIGDGKHDYEILVKDLSATGISFICDKPEVLQPGTVVRVVFEDKTIRKKFDLGIVVVRCEEDDRHRLVYGCRLNKSNDMISKYVNEKQRTKLKMSRNVNIRNKKI